METKSFVFFLYLFIRAYDDVSMETAHECHDIVNNHNKQMRSVNLLELCNTIDRVLRSHVGKMKVCSESSIHSLDIP